MTTEVLLECKADGPTVNMQEICNSIAESLNIWQSPKFRKGPRGGIDLSDSEPCISLEILHVSLKSFIYRVPNSESDSIFSFFFA